MVSPWTCPRQLFWKTEGMQTDTNYMLRRWTRWNYFAKFVLSLSLSSPFSLLLLALGFLIYDVVNYKCEDYHCGRRRKDLAHTMQGRLIDGGSLWLGEGRLTGTWKTTGQGGTTGTWRDNGAKEGLLSSRASSVFVLKSFECVVLVPLSLSIVTSFRVKSSLCLFSVVHSEGEKSKHPQVCGQVRLPSV